MERRQPDKMGRGFLDRGNSVCEDPEVKRRAEAEAQGHGREGLHGEDMKPRVGGGELGGGAVVQV